MKCYSSNITVDIEIRLLENHPIEFPVIEEEEDDETGKGKKTRSTRTKIQRSTRTMRTTMQEAFVAEIPAKQWERLKGKLPRGFRWEIQGAIRENNKGRASGGIITGVKESLKEKVVGKKTEGMQERKVKIKGNGIG